MMADTDDGRFRVKLLLSRRDTGHGHQDRALNAASLVLPGLSHIEQQRLHTCRVRQPQGEFGGGDMFHASEAECRGLLGIAQRFDTGFKQFYRVPCIVGHARNHAGRHDWRFTDDRQKPSTHAQLTQKSLWHHG